MKKRKALLFLLAACLWLLCGCTSANPLEKAEATPVPGLPMPLHAASASKDNVDEVEVSLYFRFMNEPLLAAEARTLRVRRDESLEASILHALLEGPSAGHGDLKPLFPASVKVESVSSRGNILYITFNEALLTDDEIPSDWANQPQWATEAPLRRALTIGSVVASITESFPYTGIQILVYRPGQVQTSLRLDNTYFLSGLTGLSEPQTRNEDLLLTPHNVAAQLMASWQRRDYETLYHYITHTNGGSPKPSFLDVAAALDTAPSLSTFTVGSGSVSANGGHAVVTLGYTLHLEGGTTPTVTYPLPLVRENDIWKIAYAELQALMLTH